ncbi:CDF family Co(II)/Ni(II) efflux transporter DmeF [Acinetobacter ursingii]|uniref:CDF family Co(II)/Ni(II) efflux transporter DmeF n=1 Tax=Acinetobacter ursingii TaxID=108980 RepID=UPI0021CF1E6C|nr:CDF family Co(II)/Ni(II) efflux transporter DmeF [Acinetobacter ursingii]MEC8058471.1 CDF family Co(II)/Ni(II) efflux transporter DmeF [Pseudomonadota bacterium]MCU4358298.1 CDF family Co(II)/Ni(II) efflux transporter DmeF [Acinetobacter ursingii]MDA3580271.1 CDF family Co(II)/Ni(II) efflux transporter DmeF [Acinetobacter ursingii]MDH0808945.1 CDF family Co(II)/Ni(II) efflux transporter DmeF [Acinetobacter ursingii]MDH2076038.1 CDF family Co(II)/Ni(II) efflux transporter DmeF [Acinetobacter
MTNNILLDQHHHQFDKGNPLAQKKILWATILTGVMMIAEISGGMIFNSMALLADGWHMSSHMVALGLAYLAYRAARYYSVDSRFCFGSWKIEVLAGYSSAILLMVVAIVMGFSSIERLFNPVIIYYNDAIGIAVVGLLVNLVCAWLLHDDHSDHHHSHHHHSEHEHSHGHDHQDLNQKAAFIHVVADAATSVLAIIALFAGKYFGWNFLDAVLGIIGAILVAKWSWGLIRQTGKILLDAEMQEPVVEEIKQVIEQFDSMIKLMDLHVWQVGKGKFACILSLQTSNRFLTPQAIKQALSIHEEIVHASIEINLIH